MAVKVRNERQSHRFHAMSLTSTEGKGVISGEVALNVVPLVDMMMVLVIFLVMNFNATGEMAFIAKDMKMPGAEHGEGVEFAPVVSVSNNTKSGTQELYMDGNILTDLGNLNLDDPNWTIAELEEKLKEQLTSCNELRAGIADIDSSACTTVNIQADKGVDYRILKRVLHTCQYAGYGKIRLAVGDHASATAKATVE